jgi:osmoprotectant transport system permease protein
VIATASITLVAVAGKVPESFYQKRTGEACEAAQPSKLFCPDWAIHHLDRYGSPAAEHIILVIASVSLGFAIAFGLALLSHRRRWVQEPLLAVTGVLYTVPSIAFFFLLLPITGFGKDTAILALSAFNVQIIYRNVLAGLANVPGGVKDAARGMGLNSRQLLWRIELPLALPEIVAGLRIATVSTVAIASLAFFAGGGGLGDPIYKQLSFLTNIILAGGIMILMALALDAMLLTAQHFVTPWRRVR